jgi:tRNA-specific 2-thiouridylase
MTKKRVLLGMSGGVDSSVSAALLKQQGYDVIGITLQLLPKEKEQISACCNLDSISDAKRVASHLGIPHYTVSIRDSFKHHVIDYFVNEYMIGRTPNPCVECNRFIKFDALQQKAKELGADFVATGHYVIREESNHKYYLKKAADPKKDQSYFLYMISGDQLSKTLFPLGGYLKTEIRKMAEDMGLINAKKSDSQDICFVSKGSYASFIEEHTGVAPKPGDILNKDGEVVGEHSGIYNYTIGQKRGLNLKLPYPLYVIAMNAKENTLTVGNIDDLHTSEIDLHTVTFTHQDDTILNTSLDIKTRYQMIPFKGEVVHINEDRAKIKAHMPQSCITPGQSCVLYDGDRIVGGGIIS